MERNEPTLVPEWLRSTGNINGAGSSGRHFYSGISSRTRNGSTRSMNDKDSTHSFSLDRSSSSNSRRGLNSSASKNPYSSFTRNHRDKNRDKEKERSSILELWDSNSSDPFGSVVASRVGKNCLRCSQSLASRKSGESVPQRAEDKKISGKNILNSSNGVLSGCNNLNGIQQATFEKDFPSLGTEEKQVVRVPSPGLSSAIQSLPISNSALLGGEKWTSALAEVPAIIGINGVGNLSSQQSGSVTLSSGTSGANNSLNMAEALSQGPARAHTTSQLPDKIHRLEELALKQSRQLIPVTPTMPKALVSISDKSKQPKPAVRTSEMVGTAKSIQQQPYSSQTNNPCCGLVRSDTPNIFHTGKFLVLRPVTTPKDTASLINVAGGKVANEQPSVSPLCPLTSTSSSTPKMSAVEGKAAALTLNSRPITEKKLSISQAQSRSDFFKLIRKKTSPKATALQDSGAVLSSSDLVGVTSKGVSCNLVSQVVEDGLIASNGDYPGSPFTFDPYNAQQCSDVDNSCLKGMIYPDEEEAAFLRSLGWDENYGEDEGLTEEEINAFYQECMKLKPSLKICKGTHLASTPADCKSGATCATESGSSELD